ncbi:hypothetical protein BDSB_12575 [Burkholderia dolosa PC543]|nr:hypothetical protein BDSB_12575 [Burkholderia dolosa PC543]
MSIVAIVRYSAAFSAQIASRPGCNGLTVPVQHVR